MARFLRYSAGLFVRPQAVFRALLSDPHRVSFGFLGILALAAVYGVGITVALAMDVAHLPQFLVLNIPAELYYSYERFFILPVGVAGTILSSGAVRLVARCWNGDGHFEDLFALLGFSMIVIAVVMGLPDLLIGVLAVAGIVAPPGFGYVGPHVWLGTLWYVLLNIVAIKEVEGLAWGRSIVLGLIGFLVNGMVQFVFIR